MARVEYGNRDLEMHLISRQAEKTDEGGRKNPYDPVILDDPKIEKLPIEDFADAENILTQIEEKPIEKGEKEKLIVIDDMGPQILKNGWFVKKVPTLSNKSNASVIVVFQDYPYNWQGKNLIDCWVYFADCAAYETKSWKRTFNLGKWGRCKSQRQQEEIKDKMFETATCKPSYQKYHFAVVYPRIRLPDGYIQ